ncbi:MAG: hypothetical protein HY064_12105 [Bacteroidetes bacterium]|nr:hypothetical protein [Bacteroidota bacterium]
MQRWKKYGLIFKPDGISSWQKSHAALPTALHLHDDVFRIYFTSRDENNRTYSGWFEINILQPEKILRRSSYPVLSPGPLGFFDDHGVQTCSLVKEGGRIWLYYLGWSPGLTQPVFYTSIGLAYSDDGGLNFKKYSQAPILERSEFDPWMVSGCSVLKESDRWRMWYISGQKFELTEKGARSFYDIKYAESEDGIHWKREGIISIPLLKGETNISRISILKTSNGYRCWYPYKREERGYRIGYAESKDGIKWERKDELAGIDVSADGWDSEALDKQEVFAHKNKLYMLYNGNRFGFDGIGMAVLEKE